MVSHRSFVKAWVHAASSKKGVDAVAGACDMTVVQVYGKANYLRKNGVALPRMYRAVYKRRGVNAKSLNQLIADSLR